MTRPVVLPCRCLLTSPSGQHQVQWCSQQQACALSSSSWIRSLPCILRQIESRVTVLFIPCSKADGTVCHVVPKPSGGLPLALRLQSAGLRTSAAQLAEHTVKVPSMGDSITEGTVASVAKQEGELCSMSETRALSMARCRCSASSAKVLTGEHVQAQLLHRVQSRLEYSIVQVHQVLPAASADALK